MIQTHLFWLAEVYLNYAKPVRLDRLGTTPITQADLDSSSSTEGKLQERGRVLLTCN